MDNLTVNVLMETFGFETYNAYALAEICDPNFSDDNLNKSNHSQIANAQIEMATNLLNAAMEHHAKAL